MKMSTISPLPQTYKQQDDYYLTNDERDQIILNFRAPPPSPTGSSRRPSSVANDGILSEFLDTKLRVPDLILPNKIFPSQKPYKEIPIVDFHKLRGNSSTDDFISRVKECFEEIGCFQVINHGISPEIIKTVARRGARIFRLAPEKKRMAVRSPELPYGFEDVSGDQEEVISEMCDEEFVWSKSCDLDLKMEGILPLKYSKFSGKMEKLASAIEKVAKDIMSILMNDQEQMFTGTRRGQLSDGSSVCHIYKHPHGVSVDQCISSLRYDVIRMMIRGTEYSHALALHCCDGSSEFHVYSKKGWTSFIPLENALVVTSGDQIQAWSGGRYKHVIGKPIYTTKNEDSISMAFLYSSPIKTTTNNDKGQQLENARTISMRDQALLAIFLTIACQFLFHFYT